MYMFNVTSFAHLRSLGSGGVRFELWVVDSEERSEVGAVLERVYERDERLDGIGTHGRGSPHHNQRLHTKIKNDKYKLNGM